MLQNINNDELVKLASAARLLQQAAQLILEIVAKASASDLHLIEGGKLDPVCAGTGARHVWGKVDRYTDGCTACPVLRPHAKRR